MLDARQHQGKFGEDYVRALASAAGLLVYRYDLDADGVDLGLREAGRAGRTCSPTVELQVKTTTSRRRSAAGWRFDGLTQHHFNQLAGRDFAVPRFLVLVLVPREPVHYASLGASGLLLGGVAYYISLRDEPRIEPGSRTRRRPVTLPTANVLTVASLRAITREVAA